MKKMKIYRIILQNGEEYRVEGVVILPRETGQCVIHKDDITAVIPASALVICIDDET